MTILTRPAPVRCRFEISDQLYAHMNIDEVGNAAVGAFVLLGSWSASNGTGGFVPYYAGVMNRPGVKDEIPALEDAGLLRPDETGWHMAHGNHDIYDLFQFVDVYRREPINPELRARVYERDGHACLHCGATEDLALDHIIPWSKGGPDTYENFQTLCRICNSRKGDR